MTAEKMIEAKGLARLEIRRAEEADVAVLIFTDTEGQSSTYAINPDGLRTILQEGLGLAAQWAERPGLQVETWSGSRSALPAQHISLERGRDETEVAVRVFVGRLELTFLIPLDDMIHATAGLVKMVDPGSGKPPH